MPSRGTQSQTVHAERRIISYSVFVHRRYQNDIYIIGCIVGEILMITWTGFTLFISMNERPSDGCTWSGKETNEETDLKSGSICLMQRKRKQSKSELSRNQGSRMPDN